MSAYAPFPRPVRHVHYLLLTVLLLFGGCGGKLYQVNPFDPAALRVRAVEQSENDLLARAAVPDADESQMIFGVPLYEQGIQPVWLEIENGTGNQIRFAPVGTDLEYFSPLEISYKNRGGFSKEGRSAMDKHFHELAMPRHINPGETASGFVLTHIRSGTKGFNVDLFGDEMNVNFTFFVTVPGLIPDHAEINFSDLYEPTDVLQLETDEIYGYLAKLPFYTTDAANAESGSPLNTALIGQGQYVLYALLRAGWRETARDESSKTIGIGDYYFFDRRQDTVFRYDGGSIEDGHYELRLWLSPVTADGTPVWLGQIRHFIDHRWIDTSPDPDVDNALWFIFQKLLYSETVLRFGWIKTGETVSINTPQTDFNVGTYFTRGIRGALWLSGDPISLRDVETLDWDDPIDP